MDWFNWSNLRIKARVRFLGVQYVSMIVDGLKGGIGPRAKGLGVELGPAGLKLDR